MKTILVTGAAGFIGSSLVDELLKSNQYEIIGIDNFDPYYSKEIKESNLKESLKNNSYKFINLDFTNFEDLNNKLDSKIDLIIHLGAKAGVRPSIEDPIAYQVANVLGTQNLLEFAKNKNIKKFIFASSSSVYGINPNYPWSESDSDLKPISPYAQTKLSGEFLGSVYSHLFGISFVALRFFTVYGPRQRPDLAINKFFRLIEEGKEITIFGDGSTSRDYTYISDIIKGIISLIDQDYKFEIFNLGNEFPVKLLDLVKTIEEVTGKEAKIKFESDQKGDVPITYANISKAKNLLGYEPKVMIKEGLAKYYQWLKSNS